MSQLKFKLLLLIVLLFSIPEMFSQSFTWSGPTSKAIGFGSNSANCGYTFTYQNIGGLVNPTLVIAVDGSVITGGLCNAGNGGWRPSSYTITLTEGTHTVLFSLLSVDPNYMNCYYPIVHQQQQISVEILFSVRVQNDFTKPDGTGGNIYVNDLYNMKDAPYDRYSLPTNYFQIGAIEQSDGNYNRIWNTSGINNSKWIKQLYSSNYSDYSYSQNTTYTVQSNDRNTSLTAGLRRVCNVPVQNNMVGIGNAGTIIINGTQYNLPANPVQVIEQNPIVVTAQNQTINGIDYYFTHWSDNPNNYQNPRTFYPTDNSTISAVFIGYPNTISMNVQNNAGTIRALPTFTWTDNVNTNVSYRIYRQVEDNNGIWSNWNLIANIGRGVNTFSDGFYRQVSGNLRNLALIIVAYYSVENIEEGASMVIFSVREIPSKRNFGNNQTAAITEYKLYDNFPNPFNPSTEIYYQLPSDGNVKLRVYNLMGQEVMTLVNEFKEKGMYNVTFNAGRLASGMYIYKLEAGSFIQVKKMLLTK